MAKAHAPVADARPDGAQDGGPCRLALPAALTAVAAIDLADRLRTLRGAPIALDAAEVARVGAQCLQVLLSAAATWRTDGVSMTLAAPSPAFLEALRLTGLSPEAFGAGEA
ncbi:MAG: STAS domain-containing protein [Rhodobacteraceae bacterium]|nr:MAG: STAS domain-containing protein [Paracoccaceae bacterium]